MSFPYGMIELQLELNSWKECGKKLSHFGIKCIDILKNHVYYPHVRQMEYAECPIHETSFSSCHRCAYNSKDNYYSLLQVWRVSIMFTYFFVYFIRHHVESFSKIITFGFFAPNILPDINMTAQYICISPVFHCTPYDLPQVSGCVIIQKLYI